jgi:N-methylhydantoinase B/oxoprolinase/acetone carboxylase alpha subunit
VCSSDLEILCIVDAAAVVRSCARCPVVADFAEARARAGADGIDVLDSDATNGMNMPIEALEQDFPLRVLRYELRGDSGGAGEYRGGLGVAREYLALGDGILLTHRGENHRSRVPGAAGGGDGASARSSIVRADGRVEVIPSKLMTVLGKGDRLVIETAGGGGFGDPQDRAAAALAADLADGKVSVAVARSGLRKDPMLAH